MKFLAVLLLLIAGVAHADTPTPYYPRSFDKNQSMGAINQNLDDITGRNRNKLNYQLGDFTCNTTDVLTGVSSKGGYVFGGTCSNFASLIVQNSTVTTALPVTGTGTPGNPVTLSDPTNLHVVTVSSNITITGLTTGTTFLANALITKDPWVDIRSFASVTGCKNDGSTNCLQAFNMALQVLGSSGGVIFIPTGVWMTTDSIAATNLEGVTFRGEGEGSIIWAHDFNGRHFDFTDSDFIQIEDLTLRGDGINAVKSTGGIIFRLFNNGNTEGNVLRNLVIGGGASDGCSGVNCGVSNSCLVMDTPITTVLERVKADGCVGDGYYLHDGTSLTLNSVYAILGTEAGFELENMTYTTLNACASEVFGIGYWFENSKAITLNATGAESNINRSVAFPGVGYQVDSGTVTCLACYARSNDGGNVVELGTGHFDRIDYKDFDSGEVTTKINSVIIRSNGKFGMNVSTPATTMDIVGSFQAGSGAIKSTITATGELMSGSSVTATAFFGDGSHLTGIPSSGSISGFLLKSGDTMTGQLTISGSSLTVGYGISAGTITVTSSATASSYFGDGQNLSNSPFGSAPTSYVVLVSTDYRSAQQMTVDVDGAYRLTPATYGNGNFLLLTVSGSKRWFSADSKDGVFRLVLVNTSSPNQSVILFDPSGARWLASFDSGGYITISPLTGGI